MNDDYTVSIDSFNNKGYKDSSDFDEWLTTEAPFKSVGVSTDSITINSAYNTGELNVTTWQQHMSSKLPIDIMYNLYPKEMKGESNDNFSF